MTDQPVKRYIVSRHGMEDADAANEYGQTKLGKHEALMVMADDFSRTDAARVEAEAKATKLDSEANELAQLNNMLLKRIASLESDLAAVTASSVEHAKTIDGLRADLARARELLQEAWDQDCTWRGTDIYKYTSLTTPPAPPPVARGERVEHLRQRGRMAMGEHPHVAEQMARDDVRELKRENERMREALRTIDGRADWCLARGVKQHGTEALTEICNVARAALHPQASERGA